jgi:asparagine N-glycosylation enzyme membrane subunit Stt3
MLIVLTPVMESSIFLVFGWSFVSVFEIFSIFLVKSIVRVFDRQSLMSYRELKKSSSLRVRLSETFFH